MRQCAFIGFGKAASVLARGLREAGLETVFFHARSPLAARGAGDGIVYSPDYASLAAASRLIISCVIGSSALEVARAALPHLGAEHIYVDANTAGPRVKQEIAALLQGTGASFVDAAIMGPVERQRHHVPIIACGGGAPFFRDALVPFGMDITVIAGEPGQAARLKLLRSIFQKGMMCLFMETLGAARRYGLAETVLDSLSKTFTTVPLHLMAETMLAKAVGKAGRMVHEMEEVCSLLASEKLPSLMSETSRKSLARCRDGGLTEPGSLDEALDLLDDLARSLSSMRKRP